MTELFETFLVGMCTTTTTTTKTLPLHECGAMFCLFLLIYGMQVNNVNLEQQSNKPFIQQASRNHSTCPSTVLGTKMSLNRTNSVTLGCCVSYAP